MSELRTGIFGDGWWAAMEPSGREHQGCRLLRARRSANGHGSSTVLGRGTNLNSVLKSTLHERLLVCVQAGLKGAAKNITMPTTTCQCIRRNIKDSAPAQMGNRSGNGSWDGAGSTSSGGHTPVEPRHRPRLF